MVMTLCPVCAERWVACQVMNTRPGQNAGAVFQHARSGRGRKLGECAEAALELELAGPHPPRLNLDCILIAS